jgi:hypothetical protein
MMDETIKNIAAALEKPVDELARDIWTLADFIESHGNKPDRDIYTLNKIAETEGVVIPVYFLKDECDAAITGIIFESFDGYGKRRTSNGWMVRKKPHWKVTWAERYGEIDQAKRDAALAEDAARKAAEEEAKKLRRVRDRFAQGYFEEVTTIDIAYKYAIADVMQQRYYWQYVESFRKSEPAAYLCRVYIEQMDQMGEELKYRVGGAAPDPSYHRSKRAMDRAIFDWKKAETFVKRVELHGFVDFKFEDITGHFFTPEFVKTAIHSAAEPDLRVDFEHLPKGTPEQTPVRRMKDHELVDDFMRFIAANPDEQSFEYEDTRLIIDTLRKIYARAKGQKTGDEVIISKDADESEAV